MCSSQNFGGEGVHDALQDGNASRCVDYSAVGRYVNVEVSLPRSMDTANEMPVAHFDVFVEKQAGTGDAKGVDEGQLGEVDGCVCGCGCGCVMT